MNVLKKASQSSDPKSSVVIKATTLNPHAAEFIPFSHRPSSLSSPSVDSGPKFETSENFGKASESSVSNVSDEEARQFWNHQLPDDLTPDFKIMGEAESQGLGGISLSNLSLIDNSDSNVFPTTSQKLKFSATPFGDDQSSGSFMNSKSWDKQYSNSDQLLDGTDINLVEFLASQFPGFAAESIAQVYFANGFDLNLTVEMLTQLELQVDVSSNQTVTTKPSSNLNSMDFPALPANENHNGISNLNGDDHPYLMFNSGSSFSTRGATDFASAVRKIASRESTMWKYEKNSSDSSVGSSRTSQVLASSFNGGSGRGDYSDRLSGRGMARGSPIWVETGESVANMYTNLREEARDHARIRNAYLEQARQAYLIGNKALAKELSAKGQMHNIQMKAAHGKAQESIYRQRNPETLHGRGVERMIDLHGLHVNEAMHVLKQELSSLRTTARLTDQRLQVYILVGTGHHTKGSRTPARLPIAVQRYLLEEEGLDFAEPQPGLLRILVH